jgi:ADP-ribose pyrophosphatase YjhB (NUDIX family)
VDPIPSTKQLLRWSEALAGIARTGLGFTESLYEQERFEEVLRVAADIRVHAEEGSGSVEDVDGLVEEWMTTVGKGVPGYVTPKVAVGAAVGNDKGEILLVQRADSGVWLYPTGWADVGYSAAEVVVKEVEEETGIQVEVVRLIAVLDGLRVGMSRIPLYSLVFQCRPLGGVLKAHPLECADVGWFPLDRLPHPLAGAERWGDHVFAALRGEPIEVLYDSVRSPVWRGDHEQA